MTPNFNLPPGHGTSRQINGEPAMCPRCFDAVLMSDDEQERNLCNDCADQDFPVLDCKGDDRAMPDEANPQPEQGVQFSRPEPISPALNATSCSRQTDERRYFSEEINQEPYEAQ